MDYSVKLEGIALLVTLILFVFHVDRQQKNNARYRMFNMCLAFSAAASLLNVLSTALLPYAALLPPWINQTVNVFYFFFQHTNFSMLMTYGFYLLNEHVPGHHCLHWAVTIIITLGVLLNALVLTNPLTGWFFSFQGGQYIRGPLNKLGFGVLGVELIMALICYVRNRDSVSHAIHRLMQSLPPLVLMLLLLQLLMPNEMMVGTVSAIVNLIFFISFQSNRNGQDTLTELPNRYTFLQSLPARMRGGRRVHLLMVDLLHYETVNRKYGARQGDALLYSVARSLERCEPKYQVFRFGNTRFVLMGAYVGQAAADAAASHVAELFMNPWGKGNLACMLDASFAHMVTQTELCDESRIIEELEDTMAQAREAQAGSIIFYDDHMREVFRRKHYVLEQVRRALDEERFKVYYQPVFDCETGRFTTAECLLRLFDDTGKLISPAEFIPLAEKNGLIDEITWLVLKKVCCFLSTHPGIALESVSINMSIQQLTDRSFFRRIHSCLAQYGVAPHRLRIEITERTTAENPALVRAVMAQLAEEGVRFYLDDFGIGYSNLLGMLTLPFETVKIDAGLLSDIEEVPQKRINTLRLLVEMLHNAGFIVVAEGIERLGQLERVKALGADRIQGYYYARPMPEEELESFLAPKKLVLMRTQDVG